jgi:hypothetical protein
VDPEHLTDTALLRRVDIRDSKVGIHNSKLDIRNSRLGIHNSKLDIRNSRLGINSKVDIHSNLPIRSSRGRGKCRRVMGSRRRRGMANMLRRV